MTLIQRGGFVLPHIPLPRIPGQARNKGRGRPEIRDSSCPARIGGKNQLLPAKHLHPPERQSQSHARHNCPTGRGPEVRSNKQRAGKQKQLTPPQHSSIIPFLLRDTVDLSRLCREAKSAIFALKHPVTQTKWCLHLCRAEGDSAVYACPLLSPFYSTTPTCGPAAGAAGRRPGRRA